MVSMTRIAMTIGFIWLLAGLLSWSGFQAPRPAKIVGTNTRLQLPDAVTAVDLKADVSTLKRLAIWAKDPAQSLSTSAPPVATEQWSRVAIMKEASGTSVLLSSPTGEVKSFKAGDTLPDGSTLVKVSTDTIVTRPPNSRKPLSHMLH